MRWALGLLLAGCVRAEAPAPPTGPVLVVGGDLNLGRRQNRITAEAGPPAALGAIAELARADLAYANLECVVATTGERTAKSERGPFHFRGRPEMVEVLTAAGIDVVGTANNHAGDYGSSALLEQAEHLDAVGISHPGSGPSRDAACAPVFRRAESLVVAFLAIDTTTPSTAAGPTSAGTCFVDPADPDGATRDLAPRIEAAREYAHLVMVGVHWGENRVREPTKQTRALGRAIVAAGADAVLGSSAHVLHGVEIYDGRPILYDAANVLFDSRDEALSPSATFSLVLGPHGVRAVSASPIWVGYGTARPANPDEAQPIVAALAEASARLGTETSFDGGRIRFAVPDPAARPGPPKVLAEPMPPTGLVRPQSPPEQCLADSVPEDARIDAVALGPLELVGVRWSPPQLVGRGMVRVETWWTVEQPLDRDYWLVPRITSTDGSTRWTGPHDGCDWIWPTSRWKPGTIWHDDYAIRPPDRVPPGEYLVDYIVRELEDEPLGVRELGRLEVGAER